MICKPPNKKATLECCESIAEAFEAARGLSQKYGELLDGALAEIAKRATDVDAALQDAA